MSGFVKNVTLKKVMEHFCKIIFYDATDEEIVFLKESTHTYSIEALEATRLLVVERKISLENSSRFTQSLPPGLNYTPLEQMFHI